jgi:hypothetical protein
VQQSDGTAFSIKADNFSIVAEAKIISNKKALTIKINILVT